jgi:hypothetical protein
MSELREAAEQYLQLRSELGYKMHRVTRMLRSFVAFAEQEGAADITTDLALRWAQQPSGAQPTTWAWRLSVVRRFATWLSASDPHTQVPPPGLLPERYRRKRPYIAKVSREIGLRPATTGGRRGRGPRLHDLRHRFAVRTLLGWYRAGIDVEREMPKLTTYLGHTHVYVTYWYIEAVPELLELAARRLENPEASRP